jgi:hypothetical protein
VSQLLVSADLNHTVAGKFIQLRHSKRAVQVPSQQPTGHAVKRKRQDDETEYQISGVTGSMGLVMLSMSSSCCDVQFLK